MNKLTTAQTARIDNETTEQAALSRTGNMDDPTLANDAFTVQLAYIRTKRDGRSIPRNLTRNSVRGKFIEIWETR